MQALAHRYITEEEYWELEKTSQVKHEYFNGNIYLMSGGSNRHAVLCSNALIALGSRLRNRRCRAVSSEQSVKVEATGLYTYPDVSVYCPRARFQGNNDDHLLSPVVLIEVLSPSTQSYDKGEKFDHYKQLDSLRDYLLISQDKMQVEHYHRLDKDEWLLRTLSTLDVEIRLESIDCVLPLSELYEDVEFPAGPRPLREQTPESENIG